MSLSIFVAHGTGDRVTPIDDPSRKSVPRLKELAYDVTCREYDGGHRAPLPIIREAFE